MVILSFLFTASKTLEADTQPAKVHEGNVSLESFDFRTFGKYHVPTTSATLRARVLKVKWLPLHGIDISWIQAPVKRQAQ